MRMTLPDPKNIICFCWKCSWQLTFRSAFYGSWINHLVWEATTHFSSAPSFYSHWIFFLDLPYTVKKVKIYLAYYRFEIIFEIYFSDYLTPCDCLCFSKLIIFFHSWSQLMMYRLDLLLSYFVIIPPFLWFKSQVFQETSTAFWFFTLLFPFEY